MTRGPDGLRDLWDFDDPSGSERRFRELAASDPALRLVALTQVARALGLQEQYGAAHALLDGVTGAGDATPEVTVRVTLERGRLLRSAGRPDDAVPLFREAAGQSAAARLEALHVDALHMLALSGTPEDRVERNREALAVARAATTEEARHWDASLLNNLGMALHDAGDLAGALAAFEEAHRLREQRGQVAEGRVARWMVGWTLRLLGRTEEALALQQVLKQELAAAGLEDPYVDEELALLRAPRPMDAQAAGGSASEG